MYERSAIVLEKNFNTILGFDQKINLKTIYKDFKELTEEIENYQQILEEEDKIINEFDKVANEIRKIQQEQKKLYKSNIKLEEDRNQLFDNLDENPEIIERKLKKIEENVAENNRRLEELRNNYVTALTNFAQKQEERNMCSRNRRAEEKKHLQIIEKTTNNLNDIDKSIIKDLKDIINSECENEKQEIIEIMINNGKDERIPFNKDVIQNAVEMRTDIAKKEAECYINAYEKTRRLIAEINNDDVKLDKYTKTLRDISVKMAFLKAKKMYIVSFLDNERMSAINGLKAHKQLMEESCNEFKTDMEQFDNLYSLILREIAGRSSKKAYKELYNKEYLKNIEEKEKNFEQEINNIKIHAGAIINSNYWRIDEIKNIYHVFQNEVSEKFGKDLSEFKLEENEDETVSDKKSEIEDDIFKTEIPDDDVEYIEEYEYDDDYEDNEDDFIEVNDDENEEVSEYENSNENFDYDDEYDDEKDENEEFEDNDEYDDDEYDDTEEYEDEYDDYEEDEYQDEEYDDYDEDDESDSYEDDNEEIKSSKTKEQTNKITKNEELETRKHGKHEKEEKKGKGLFNKFFK